MKMKVWQNKKGDNHKLNQTIKEALNNLSNKNKRIKSKIKYSQWIMLVVQLKLKKEENLQKQAKIQRYKRKGKIYNLNKVIMNNYLKNTH